MISDYILMQLKTHNIIQDNETIYYTYSIKKGLAIISHYIIIFILGFIFKRINFSILSIITLYLLKRYTGGAHASNTHLCFIMCIVMFFYSIKTFENYNFCLLCIIIIMLDQLAGTLQNKKRRN